MRVLFILKQTGYIRHFATVVRALVDAGHSVRLACQDGERAMPFGLDGHPNVSTTPCGSKRGDQWQEYISLVRRTGDYLRYLTPAFAGAAKLRARAFEKLVQTVSNGKRDPVPGLADQGLSLTSEEQDRLRSLVAMLEGLIPPDASAQEFIRQENPDIVLITPLVDIGSGQADYVKACRSLDVPVAMVLFSWDNLSTKGLIHEFPDQVFVWNERQVREAVELHGVPERNITITGAPRFDEFFALQPSIDRETFCAHLGLDRGAPMVVYLGSSRFVAEREDAFIQRWIDTVRARPGLEHVNILVKPHPDLHSEWGEEGERVAWQGPDGEVRLRLTRPFPFERVVVVRAPFTGAQFLYDCLHQAAAVVGLNTSAEIEAGILDRPVLTIRVPDEFADGQESTLHFHYLLKEQGGFVESASDLGEHCAQLARVIAGDFDREGIRGFITSFVRPSGRATDVLVRCVERLAKRAAKRRLAAAAPAPAVGPAHDDRAETAPETIVELDYTPIRIRLRATSEPERQWRARSCRKEPWTVEWIERVVRDDSVLYDIGANVGTFTLIAARRQPTATVVAFEPGYASYAHLCENVMLNQCQGNVIPVSLPLWSSTTLVSLKYRTLDPGQSRHDIREQPPRRGAPSSDGRYEQPVLAARLDDLVRHFALPPPTVIKLDVDGGELEVLRGARETLRLPGLESLLVEFSRALEKDVTALLAEAGFHRVATVKRKKARAPGYAEFRRT